MAPSFAQAAPLPALNMPAEGNIHHVQYRRDRDRRVERRVIERRVVRPRVERRIIERRVVRPRVERRIIERRVVRPGFVRRGDVVYLNRHRGYRDYRRGYRRYNGWWFPPAAFIGGAILGSAIASPPPVVVPSPVRLSAAHVDWCHNRWRSYRASDNTYQPYEGPRRVCVSPYGG
jgi:hypothetical protein